MRINIFIFSCILLCSCSTSRRLDKAFTPYTLNHSPGFVVAILEDGKLIRKTTYGHSDLKNNTKIKYDTRFRIASLTKAFTGMKILQLEQDGLIHPDNKISDYINGLPSFMKNIKVKHLVFHTSGLPAYNELCVRGEYKNPITNKDVMKWLHKQKKLDFIPGSKFVYSNTGYIVLAQIIEQITRRKFSASVEENIFRPLKMNDATFMTVENEHNLNRAHGYKDGQPFESDEKDSCNFTQGEDGIFLHINDMIKWTKAMTTDTLVNKEFREKIYTSGLTDTGKKIDYSYGWGLLESSYGDVISHTGSWAGYRSLIRYYKKWNVWILVLSNYKELPMDDIIIYSENEVF